MKKISKAAAFLENMTQQDSIEVVKPIAVSEKKVQNKSKQQPPSTRKGLKHIGGYFDTDMDEKFAVLRARLKLDNSELITLAINELYSRQKAKRAFND